MLSHAGHVEVQDNHVGRQNEVASAERQSSINEIENVLKRVPLRPFNRIYEENILLNSSSNGKQASGSQFIQNEFQKPVNPFLHPAQNGFQKSVNPFLHPVQDTNASTASGDNNKDLMLKYGQSNGWSHFPTSSTPSFENDWAVFPPPSLSQKSNQTTFPSQKQDLFQDPFTAKTSLPGLNNQQTDIFQPFKEETSVSHKMVSNEETSDKRDFLLEYILANQKNNKEPIPSTTASNQLDIFSSPSVLDDGIFTKTAASQSSDIFQTPESSVPNRVAHNIQLFQTLASVQKEKSHVSDYPTVSNGQFKPQNSQHDNLFMPTELNPEIFEEISPLNASTNGGVMFKRLPPKPAPRSKTPRNHNQSINHDIFSTPVVSVPADQKPAQSLISPTLAIPRPRPAVPRAINNHPENILLNGSANGKQASGSQITQKSVNPFLQSAQDTKLADDVNQSQVYEDVLFIGQEKCVEDWPEDSPELSPDWKPSGKLKLRRDSIRIAQESEAALLGDSLGKKSGKTKMRPSFSRRGSKVKSLEDPTVLQTDTKEMYPDSLYGAYGDTLPWRTKFHASDEVILSEEDHNAKMKSKSVKSKKTKFVVPHLHYKGSKKNSLGDVFENGSFPNTSKNELIQESYEDKLRNSEQKEPVIKDWRPKESMKFKSSMAHRLSKDAIEDDLKKMNGLSFLEESKENVVVRPKKERRRFSADLLTEYQHDPFSPISKTQELQDTQPKKSIKFKVPHLPRKGSKSTLENDIPEKGADIFKASDIKPLEIDPSENYNQVLNEEKVKGAGLFKAGDIPDDDWTEKHSMENVAVRPKKESRRFSADLLTENQHDPFSPISKTQELPDTRPKKPIKFKVPHLLRKGSKSTLENDIPEKGADLFKASDIKPLEIDPSENYNQVLNEEKVKGAGLFKPGDIPDGDWTEKHSMDEDQTYFTEDIEPPGATSGDYFSEAAKAEWMSSQIDARRAKMVDKKYEEEEGDTDSLMEWWSTVESWDELPDEETSVKEDETKSFTEIADKVHRGLRVFYKVYTEQAEVLYLNVQRLYAIGDDISNFHRRAKIANITGGTTTAVGGVAAIAGLALAPVTLGASLIVSAVGLGVATAGGITAASASISDNVHDMNDRKKIEVVLQDYETRLVELRSSLSFVAEGVRRLRFHPLLRRNNYYAGDWEVRRALQTISLVGEPVDHAEDIVEQTTKALYSVYKGMDNYFCKDSKELKKGCKKEVTTQVNMLAKLLHDGLVALNSIREQLMEATGLV